MVRTAGSAVRVGGKAPKKGNMSSNTSSRSSSPSRSAEKGFSSYNAVCPRDTPTWQKPITSFFNQCDKSTAKKPTTSKDQPEDVNMESTNRLETDKENSLPTIMPTSNIDLRMKEVSELAKKKINLRDDDDEDQTPKKKIKLDAARMHQHFKTLEEVEMMIS